MKAMRGFFHIVLVLYLMLLTNPCESKKRHNKRRNQKQNLGAQHAGLAARAVVSLNGVMHEICLPSGSNRLVYRYQNDSHIFIGFDDLKRDTVYSMSWKINEEALTRNNHNEFAIHPSSEVRKHVKLEHLLAAADEKVQNRFLDRISECSQSRITSRACVIQSFAASARKMKEVKFSEKCSND